MQWRKLVAEFGGTEKFFADQDDFFLTKIPIFATKISDDLFLVIDQVFRIFPLFSLNFQDLYFVRYRTQPFPHKKNTFSPILAAKKQNFF